MGARMTARTASAEAADRAVAMRRFVPRFEGNDEALVLALREGNQAAASELVRRHGPYVERVLARILGVDGELPDLLHDVFVCALDSIDSLKNQGMLKEWLRGVAVFVARGCLRRRRRRRWLVFRPAEELPDI